MIDLILKSFWLHPVRWLVFIVLIASSFFVICSGGETNTSKTNNIETVESEEQATQESAPPDSLIESGRIPDSPDQPVEKPSRTENTNARDEKADPVADESEEEVLKGKEISAQRAALPFLPVKTGTIEGEYKTQLSNGLLLVEVRYRKSKEAAIKDWQDFLDKYQDPGTAYLVVYKPV